MSPTAKPPVIRGRNGIKRVLVVGSHAWSTLDAYSGLVAGFRDAGYDTHTYDLHTRLEAASEWLKFCVKRWGTADDPEPSQDDTIYQAGIRCVVKALEVNADAVVVVCGLLFHPSLYLLFERMGMPVFLYGTESPYDDELYRNVAKLSTACSLNEAGSVAGIQRAVHDSGETTPVAYLPLGYNPTIHRPGFADSLAVSHAGEIPAHDVVFIGNMYPSRAAWMEAIDWTGIDLGIYGIFDAIPDDSPLRKYIKGGVVRNTAACAIYQRSKIVLNLFRAEQFGPEWTVIGTHKGTSLNPRVIEAAAAGACLVSEWRPELDTVFGTAVPFAYNPEQCETIIRDLLAKPERRAAIGASLPPLVESFSYTNRARQIVGMLGAEIARTPLVELEATR